MGVEVAQDESIILGLEKSGERGSVVGWARGVWGDVDVVDVDGNVVDGDGDGEVFGGGVVGEEVGREVGVGEGVVDEDDEAAPA